jgi:hypothetical protein
MVLWAEPRCGRGGDVRRTRRCCGSRGCRTCGGVVSGGESSGRRMRRCGEDEVGRQVLVLPRIVAGLRLQL